MSDAFLVNLGIFLVMQVLAQAAMKVGSAEGAPMRSRRWWTGFVAANAVGATSILFLKELYNAMPDKPNVVLAITTAGAFILTQLVFLAVFRVRPTARQWSGIALLAVGGFLASWRP